MKFLGYFFFFYLFQAHAQTSFDDLQIEIAELCTSGQVVDQQTLVKKLKDLYLCIRIEKDPKTKVALMNCLNNPWHIKPRESKHPLMYHIVSSAVQRKEKNHEALCSLIGFLSDVRALNGCGVKLNPASFSVLTGRTFNVERGGRRIVMQENFAWYLRNLSENQYCKNMVAALNGLICNKRKELCEYVAEQAVEKNKFRREQSQRDRLLHHERLIVERKIFIGDYAAKRCHIEW